MLYIILRLLMILAAAVQTAIAIVIVSGLSMLILPAFSVAAKPSGGVVQPKIFKPIVKAKAVSRSYAGLTDKAIDKWKMRTRSLYGSSFADFNQAQIVSIPIGFSNGKRWVIVKAKPCKPIGFGLKPEPEYVPKQYNLSLPR